MLNSVFGEASDVNVRNGYVSGTVVTNTAYETTSGVASYISGAIPQSANYTAARAAYLDNFTYYKNRWVVNAADFASGLLHGTSDDTATSYTVPAGSSLILKSIAFSIGENDSSDASKVTWGISGTTPNLIVISTGSNTSMDTVPHCGNLSFGPGMRVPTGSLVLLTIHESTTTSYESWIAWWGILVKD